MFGTNIKSLTNTSEMKKPLFILMIILFNQTLFAQSSSYTLNKSKEINYPIFKNNLFNNFPKNNKIETCLLTNKVTIQDSVMVTKEIEYMKECLRKFNKKYYTGLGLSITGIGIAFVGYNGNFDNKFFVMVGSALAISGQLIMIESHRWIGKAGLGLSGNGVSVNYIIK